MGSARRDWASAGAPAKTKAAKALSARTMRWAKHDPLFTTTSEGGEDKKQNSKSRDYRRRSMGPAAGAGCSAGMIRSARAAALPNPPRQMPLDGASACARLLAQQLG